ncbi:MAG: NAD(P)/FAD-dependent oxidoreductase [Thermoplasmata archaeon]|nr:MAG: NAD(P)/FAD-dependent oxidoreductase [Thermoplasmata archaeon]
MSVVNSRNRMHVDFAVVGAGPAGAHIAGALARTGFKVALVEQYGRGRDKPCGGLIDLALWDMLGSARNGLPAWPIRGTAVFSLGTNHITFRSEKTRSYAVFRSELDTLLSDRAEQCGANLLENTKVRGIKYNDSGVRLINGNGTAITSDMVVGADGTYSIVARSANLRPEVGHSELIFCLVSEFPLGQSRLEREIEDINTIEVYMLGGLGYGWVIPKGDYVNIGCGQAYDHLQNSNELWRKFLRTLHRHSRFVYTKIPRPKGYFYRSLKGPVVRTYADRTVLLGDAAGFANNLSGEGIWPAIQSADIALPVLERAFTNGDYSTSALELYEKNWKRRFQSEFIRKQKLLQLITQISIIRKGFLGRLIGVQAWSEGETFDRALQFIKDHKELYYMLNEVYQHRNAAVVVLPKLKKKLPSFALDYFGTSLYRRLRGEQPNY